MKDEIPRLWAEKKPKITFKTKVPLAIYETTVRISEGIFQL